MLLVNPQSLDQMSEKIRSPHSDMPPEFNRILALLDKKDRLLVEMAMKHHLSRRQIGQVLGRTPGTITRKIRSVINRLNDPLILALADPNCCLSPDHRQIAIEHFLHRSSIAALARQRAISRHEIRATLDYVRGWHRGITASR